MMSETREHLGRILSALRNASKLIVISKSFYEVNKNYLKEIEPNQKDVIELSLSHPTWDDCINLFHQVSSKKWSQIIAIGGGSIIDICKGLVGLRLIQDWGLFHPNLSILEANEILHNKRDSSRIKFCAIPTVAGSGAEQTKFASFWHINNNEVNLDESPKESLEDFRLRPTQVELIPEFLASVPKTIKLAGIFDALSHCVEAYYSTSATRESTSYSIEGLRGISELLELDYETLKMREVEAKVLNLAQLGGKAINIAKTNVCHSLSYPITSQFQVIHGFAAAISLPIYLEVAKKSNPQSYDTLSKTCNGKEPIELIRNSLDKFGIRAFVCQKIGSKIKLEKNVLAMQANSRFKNCSFEISGNFLQEVSSFIFD